MIDAIAIMIVIMALAIVCFILGIAVGAAWTDHLWSERFK